ncbi:unnamed protein product, partial [Ectocarpus fasciculatus]
CTWPVAWRSRPTRPHRSDTNAEPYTFLLVWYTALVSLCVRLLAAAEPRECHRSICTKQAKRSGTRMKNERKSKRKECEHEDCTKTPTFGRSTDQRPRFCAKHAEDAMVDVCNKKCGNTECNKIPSYGHIGTKTALFCAKHAEDEMVDVRTKRCAHESGCTTSPSYAEKGAKTGIFCAKHAKPGMQSVRRQKCDQAGCAAEPSYGEKGSRRPKFCSTHASEVMIE